MALTKTDFAAYIKQFNFKELFNDMGWNNDKTSQPITIDNITYSLQAVAEKSGFKILICNPTEAGTIPDYNVRKKIETKLTKLFQEHLIIFIDAKKQEQIWQLVVRQSGKPAKVTETRYHISQDPELLFQRAAGIFFEMDEEENITIVDVTKRVADNFHQNNEKVTKQFYESFKKQHTSFLSFIKGIDGKADKDWYASLMLNRLMFCYFIQKKGFLDNDKNYLRHKLNLCKEKKGKDKFYSFYRSFLLVLFHEGLNEPAQKEKIKIEIGKIPYLNGGLFDEHELEKSYEIDIDDKAFERIFDFFDQYEWHLDTRIEATGKDINPDVIGYIFEKYINDRAQMGAYYTKEDITDYISKNCIIPWLFDETARNYPKAFAAKGEIWKALQESGDTYIYDAVKYGTDISLPKNIQAGIKDVAKRTDWNKQATTDLGLPTEIWREVVERRNRYEEVKNKIESGEITAINDFITYNLNIRQFTQDIIENSDDPDFIRAFYKAINNVTIIDPTCGSGAFLFAAMNILEPLYHACIMRMRAFTEDEDRENEQEKKTFKNKYKYFREVLENIQSEQHPNLQYFIYKSIILNNLYGVDIMREAVEIAKLRLFLKLVATVEADYKKKNLGLEPLPDIDFNIRAGNSLVGFATESELKKGGNYTLDFDQSMPEIEEKCDIVANAFKHYKVIQLTYGEDFKSFKIAKEDLVSRLDELTADLDSIMHKQALKLKYDVWLHDHQPFHWFAEFYEIINHNGGFDIIIGNPPYTEIPKNINRNYLKKYSTALDNWSRDENLYTLVIEQSFNILNKNGVFGMIIPLSITFSTKKPFQNLRKNLLKQKFNWWWLHYDRIPCGLFGNEVRTRCTILLKGSINKTNNNYTTALKRWSSEYRDVLFDTINFSNVNVDFSNNFPKVGSQIQADAVMELLKGKRFLDEDLKNSIPFSKLKSVAPNFPQPAVYVGGTAYNWFPAWRDIPESFDEKRKPSLPARTAGFLFSKEEDANIVFALLCSSLGYWWWAVASDAFNLKKWLISTFPFSLSSIQPENKKELAALGKKLNTALKKQYVFKDNKGKIGNYYLPECKEEIAEIDFFLASHLKGLSKEFFGDINAFNSSFSRASISEQDDEDEDD